MTGFTLEDEQKLMAAVANPAGKLRLSNGEEVTLRSLDEIQRALAMVRRARSQQSAARQHYPSFTKGT